jgi:hypothetical protein
VAISEAEIVRVGDTVRIIGHSRHTGKTGMVRYILPNSILPIGVEIGKFLYFFSYTEVVKI